MREFLTYPIRTYHVLPIMLGFACGLTATGILFTVNEKGCCTGPERLGFALFIACGVLLLTAFYYFVVDFNRGKEFRDEED